MSRSVVLFFCHRVLPRGSGVIHHFLRVKPGNWPVGFTIAFSNFR